MLIYAKNRHQAGQVVTRALAFVLHVEVTNVSGSEECFAIMIERGIMNDAEVAEVIGDAELYGSPQV